MRRDRLFIIVAAASVALGLVLAFAIIGTPQHARLVALDERRVRDLDSIASDIHDRFAEKSAHVPARLPNDLVRNDPVTHVPYAFKRIDATHYTLCATFAAASEREDRNDDLDRYRISKKWSHGSGRACYEFNLVSASPEPRVLRR